MLTNEEIIDLEEKLILIYKSLHQRKLSTKFLFQGLEDQLPKQDLSKNPLVNKIVNSNDPNTLLKKHILKLEKLRTDEDKEDCELSDDDLFKTIILKYKLMQLSNKYNLKTEAQLDKLDINNLTIIDE